MKEKHILIIPDKADIERESVAKAWEAFGGEVFRLGKFWNPPVFETNQLHVYGNDTFCLVLQQKLGFELISPNDDFMDGIGFEWLKRQLNFQPLEKVRTVEFPTFIKSAAPKIFKAAVYNSKDELDDECTNLSDDTLVIQSEIVEWECEARAFIYQNKILDCSIYEGNGLLNEIYDFIEEFLSEISIPKTCVLDFGKIIDRGWALIEANPSWGAGLNGCNANKVLPAIINASYFET